MSERISPGSDKMMDISETSTATEDLADDDDDHHHHHNENQGNLNISSQVLRLRDSQNDENLDNDCSSVGDRTTKTTTTIENATNYHPLMYTSNSTEISPDYPDLIPERPIKRYQKNHHTLEFYPQSHSTPTTTNNNNNDNNNKKDDVIIDDVEIIEKQFQRELKDYTEKLPDFPASPSILKKTLMFDLPLEISQCSSSSNHGDLSDTENDKSIYEAHLSSNLQNVSLTMNEKEGNLNFLAQNKSSNKLRRVKVLPTKEEKVVEPINKDSDGDDDDDDISSLDSISESLKSEDVYDRNNDGAITTTTRSPPPEPIEPLSAADERRHARYWQRMILPDGEQRTIDMRVIEPYKRCLSHGGYLRAGGHTAIVIFSACYLPDRSRVDYVYVMDNLFLYILWTLERLVTDDYVLVYLHGGTATKLPAFSWLKRCYQIVSRRLRKNLSHLYLVHPTLWIKTMLFMAKPFISAKFYRKITYVGNLKELMARVPLEINAIPDKVKAYDSLHCST